jgi:hypothetical protein
LSCNHIRFIGGGRWATIVLTELVKEFPNLKVDWICRTNASNKTKFIRSSTLYKNVNPVDDKKIEELVWPDKIIIASHSSQHCSDLKIHASCGVDILIEKPLFPVFLDFETLSEIDLNRIFINTEFYNAYFISDFFDEIKLFDINNIEIFWHDPLTETRSSEDNKCSEIYSSIFMDQLLHVMSVCKLMKFNIKNFNELKIETNNVTPHKGIKIYCNFGNVEVSISLSRFAEQRERKIVINHGESSLDFSSAPYIKKSDGYIKEISPSGRPFPIAQTLINFLNYPDQSNMYSLSLKSLTPEIKFCFECEEVFIDNFSGQLISLKENKSYLNTYNADTDSNLIYYLGIKYYRHLMNSISYPEIHFLKGKLGVQKLLDWWYLQSNN